MWSGAVGDGERKEEAEVYKMIACLLVGNTVYWE